MPKLRTIQAGPTATRTSGVSATGAAFGSGIGQGLENLGQGMQVLQAHYQQMQDEADAIEAGNTLADLEFEATQQLQDAIRNTPVDSTDDVLTAQTEALQSRLDAAVYNSKNDVTKKILTKGTSRIANNFRTKLFVGEVARSDKRNSVMANTLIEKDKSQLVLEPGQFMNKATDAIQAIDALTLPEQVKSALKARVPSEYANTAATAHINNAMTEQGVNDALQEIQSSKWDSVLSAKERLQLGRQAKARINVIKVEEASKNAKVWKTEAIQAATEFTDLMINIRRGEATEEQIESFRKEHTKVNGGRDPRPALSQYRQLMATYLGGKSKNAKEVKIANNILDVAEGLKTGREFHPTHDKKKLNDYYDHVNEQIFEPMKKQDPDMAEQYIIANMFEFAKSTKAIPTNFLVDVENMLRSDNPDRVVAGAARYQAMNNLGKSFEIQLSKREYSDRAIAINELMLHASNPKDALSQLLEMENVNNTIAEQRSETADALLNPSGLVFKGQDSRERASTALDELDIDVDADELPDGVSLDYQNAFKTAYIRTGNEDIAHATARQAVRGNWSESGFSGFGDPVLLFAAPEQRYGLPGTDQEYNYKWQREQLMQDYKEHLKSTNRSEVFHSDDEFSKTLVVMQHPYAKFEGKPTYIVYRDLFDEDGVYQRRVPLFGEGTYNSLPWHPNWETSPEKARQDVEAQKKIKQARDANSEDAIWIPQL